MLFFFQGIVFILNLLCIFRRILGLTSLLCMQSSLLTEDGIIDLKMYDRSKQRSPFDLQQNRTDGPFYISM